MYGVWSVSYTHLFEDSIGTLFFDISKIVREKNPKVIFIKNVKNFAIHYGEKPYTLSKAL